MQYFAKIIKDDRKYFSIKLSTFSERKVLFLVYMWMWKLYLALASPLFLYRIWNIKKYNLYKQTLIPEYVVGISTPSIPYKEIVGVEVYVFLLSYISYVQCIYKDLIIFHHKCIEAYRFFFFCCFFFTVIYMNFKLSISGLVGSFFFCF